MRITNAHQNNLKNIDLEIPEGQLIVLTGLSGSGKSSLAMGVIANEGYRHFLESLPQYTQQNALSIPSADLDEIQDLPPVVKVEQSKLFQSTKATFGTLSELTAVFRILFARFSSENTLSKSLFSFNHPKGACELCKGIGKEEFIDLNKLLNDENFSLREGVIKTTLPNGYTVYSQVTIEELNKVCLAHDFNVDTPWKDLSEEQKNVILYGSKRIKVFYGKHSIESRLKWTGIKAKPREEGYYKGMFPIMEDILRRDRNANILRFVSARECSSCRGARIKAEHLQYKWKGLNFNEWMNLPLEGLYERLEKQCYSKGEDKLLHPLKTKLNDFIRLGMGSLSMATPSAELSAGDAQRIKLINQANTNLQGILYVFDEPSIGLSEDFQDYLLHILKRLICLGNTVMVVEHDLDFIRSADWIIELGPGSGNEGGLLVFNGKLKDFLSAKKLDSPTLKAMLESSSANKWKPRGINKLRNDLKPQELLVITRKTNELQKEIDAYCDRKTFNLVTVSDKPIGKTPRSNPSTYTGIADNIRDLLAKTPKAKELKLSKSAFSFNNKLGRCEECEGAGVITLSMSVMGTVNQVCPSCSGKRFKPEVLKVLWEGKNISDIYNLSIESAYTFFKDEVKLSKALGLMRQLGLGYLKLGQASNTLSGGEAQRIKLTKHFAKSSLKTLLVLEEPSIGLHHQNVQELLIALHQLKKESAGIVCFENHRLFQEQADFLLDNTLKSTWKPPKILKNKAIDSIKIKGAKTHKLKNLSLEIPKHKLTVVTGISGSGKSSLVIDTLHGYGQQELNKQFSSYQNTRLGNDYQFEVDSIEGLTPTICVTRKHQHYSIRSDISKRTGIDRILRFAFSRKAMFEKKEWSASHFSDNHELGKCPTCDGIGQVKRPDLSKIVLDAAKSINQGLFEHNKKLAYYGHPGSQYTAILEEIGKEHGFNLDSPWEELTEANREIILYGTGDLVWKTTWVFKTKTREGKQKLSMSWKGLLNHLQEDYFLTRKNKNIAELEALFSEEACATCQASGLKAERLEIKLDSKAIHELKSMSFTELVTWLKQHKAASEIDRKLMDNILQNVENTAKVAQQLRIDHLSLNRKSSTLSGGENQRIELIKQLNSPLKGITYLLDEPSAGLSSNNIPDLIELLQELRAKGNTVIAIEHNKDLMHAADYLVELGPKAGKEGGEITFKGKAKEFFDQEDCHPYLKKPQKTIELVQGSSFIGLKNIDIYTLKRAELKIPVGGISAITGNSGVGKTTLVKEVLIPSIREARPIYCSDIELAKEYAGAHYYEAAALRTYNNTLLADYLGLLAELMKLFAKETGRKSKDFSYKNKASQCPNCNGLGTVETHLDISSKHIELCSVCKGKRYTEEILSYKLHAQSIADLLDFNINIISEWIKTFKVSSKTTAHLNQLNEIGLGHLSLNQTVRSLSSGEKQRLLLLNCLRDKRENHLYVLDEPSTGLHFSDIELLFDILKKLSEHNDILVIDHNPFLLEKIGIGIELS
jgi:excinuclease UvrABC ATPase subunit